MQKRAWNLIFGAFMFFLGFTANNFYNNHLKPYHIEKSGSSYYLAAKDKKHAIRENGYVGTLDELVGVVKEEAKNNDYVLHDLLSYSQNTLEKLNSNYKTKEPFFEEPYALRIIVADGEVYLTDKKTIQPIYRNLNVGTSKHKLKGLINDTYYQLKTSNMQDFIFKNILLGYIAQ